jgi:hypothetical protein
LVQYYWTLQFGHFETVSRRIKFKIFR